jgi:hypothetical protein
VAKAVAKAEFYETIAKFGRKEPPAYPSWIASFTACEKQRASPIFLLLWLVLKLIGTTYLI